MLISRILENQSCSIKKSVVLTLPANSYFTERRVTGGGASPRVGGVSSIRFMFPPNLVEKRPFLLKKLRSSNAI